MQSEWKFQSEYKDYFKNRTTLVRTLACKFGSRMNTTNTIFLIAKTYCRYLYNGGDGKWIHCVHLACLRNRFHHKTLWRCLRNRFYHKIASKIGFTKKLCKIASKIGFTTKLCKIDSEIGFTICTCENASEIGFTTKLFQPFQPLTL